MWIFPIIWKHQHGCCENPLYSRLCLMLALHFSHQYIKLNKLSFERLVFQKIEIVNSSSRLTLLYIYNNFKQFTQLNLHRPHFLRLFILYPRSQGLLRFQDGGPAWRRPWDRLPKCSMNRGVIYDQNSFFLHLTNGSRIKYRKLLHDSWRILAAYARVFSTTGCHLESRVDPGNEVVRYTFYDNVKFGFLIRQVKNKHLH